MPFFCVFCAALALFAVEKIVAQQGGPSKPLPIEPTKVFVFDIKGNGFQLSSPAEGVVFDMDGTGRAVRTAWTARSSDDGFLVLDLNANGRIDSGREILGSAWRTTDGKRVTGNEALRLVQAYGPTLKGGRATRQPPQTIVMGGRSVQLPAPPVPDLSGGIGPEDDVYPRLRAWVDGNHDGRSEVAELLTLMTLGISRVYMGFQ